MRIKEIESDLTELERKILHQLSLENNHLISILNNISSPTKTYRVMNHIRKFINILKIRTRAKKEGKQLKHLSLIKKLDKNFYIEVSAEELALSREYVIQQYQLCYCATEFKSIIYKEKIKEPYQSLHLFIAARGLIRVDSTLTRVPKNCQPYVGQPILIPKISLNETEFFKIRIITYKLIEESHLNVLHRGTAATNTDLRDKYYILGMSQKVQKWISRCVTCRRQNAKCETVPTGSIPTQVTRATIPMLHLAVVALSISSQKDRKEVLGLKLKEKA
ncbi:hypothetical protein PVAND_014996 [Polypedilum vanderplanki]|uniref:Integrase zinc-binding domain-containing protein n=1 Tax=Polypedilum vanderplanki TaxID=319348 RepID=A0A9J6BAT4_POLVA|nr:hypothetical protein PVAND_014996 [Polypedilum vanderplanki]